MNRRDAMASLLAAAGTLLGPHSRPEKTVTDIVAAAKAKPDDWSFATAQLGAPGHLAEVAFNQYTGLNVPIVVYRGTGPAANDVVGGHVPMMMEAILSLLPLVKAGSVRAVAVTSKKRTPLALEIPTMMELGLPQLDFGAWWALWGPPDMQGDLVQTLNGWINDAVKALATEGRLAALGIEPAAETPQALAQFMRADLEHSEKLLRAANFHPQ
jgi:tripartite-type tricarboxylate transporter receptor subunit TctC